jgi:uncharacterized membrane protein
VHRPAGARRLLGTLGRMALKAHLPAVGFFAAAGLFYLVGSSTPAIIFLAIGFVVELAGWIYLAGGSDEEKDRSEN